MVFLVFEVRSRPGYQSLQRVEKGVSTTGVGVSLHVAASLAIVSEKR
jgi:hypothetical protein